MTKGTPSQGKRGRHGNTVFCRRCGKKSFHTSKKTCSSCGYGSSPRLRSYNWKKPGK